MSGGDCIICPKCRMPVWDEGADECICVPWWLTLLRWFGHKNTRKETEAAFFPILKGISEVLAATIVERLERIEEVERRQAAA